MDINQSLALLAGPSAAQCMRRYWREGHFLVRQAVPGFEPLFKRAEPRRLAGKNAINCLVRRTEAHCTHSTESQLKPEGKAYEVSKCIRRIPGLAGRTV